MRYLDGVVEKGKMNCNYKGFIGKICIINVFFRGLVINFIIESIWKEVLIL